MTRSKKEYQKDWYLKNRESILLQRKEEYYADLETSRAKIRNSYKKHRQKRLENLKLDRKENFDKYKSYDLKKQFGISLQDYNKLLETQQNKCKICNKHKDEFKKQLAVDHCHKTGKIRGLLCEKCNVGLGSFKDDTKCLKRAIEYLEENNGKNITLTE